MAWWHRTTKREPDDGQVKKGVPSGVWTKCTRCQEILVTRDFIAAHRVCPACGYHGALRVHERIALLLDRDSFREIATNTTSVDPLSFIDSKPYPDRIGAAQNKTGLNEAVLVGMGLMGGRRIAFGVMAFEYMGGSMGSVVGERITRLFEIAYKRRCPVILCSASGGARMQEGILSLMQMAKTTSALRRVRECGLPFISVLLNPTTGGVAASFSMLGDINIAEPNALIGFAGARVIEQTIGEKLPAGFQRAEFLQSHGMIDKVVPRSELRSTLIQLLDLLLPTAIHAVEAPEH